jgi:hypothetical protein
MKRIELPALFTALRILAAVCLVFSSCTYEVPITASPTRKIDPRLLGDWVSSDGKDKFVIRKFDDSTYVVSDNGDLFRAYHSDVGGTAFVSVQHLETTDRKYVYVTWKLSASGRQLHLRAVSTKVVPETIKNSADVRRLLERKRQNSQLLGEELRLTKVK